MKTKTYNIAIAALIAAVYAALTVALPFMSYGMIQVRVSEVLTVLPYFTPSAVPGLFVGCVLANIISPTGPIDMVVGGAATLIAAILSRKMPSKWLVPLPPVICNAVFVGAELYFFAGMPLAASIMWVGLGEAVACYGGGLPLLLAIEKKTAKTNNFKR